MNEYNGKINYGQQNYGMEVDVFDPCLPREIKSKILTRSVISRGESREMRSIFHCGLSRLSRGRTSVHWGEMRSKFQREGRPDMALFLFTKAILEDQPIKVFNNGNMVRDFTYVDDIVEGVVRVIDNPPAESTFKARVPEELATKGPHPNSTEAPYKVYNIGNSSPVPLMEYIAAIETTLGKTAQKEFLPMQPGDVPRTEADVTNLVENLGYKPDTPVSAGIEKFIKWYKQPETM